MPRLSRSDRYFLFVLLGLAGLVAGSWYMFNSNSPRQKREVYSVLFEEVGTLDRGDPVRVNGLPAGEVRAVRLTGDGMVEVEVGVFQTISLPSDSRFHLVSEGLVGERVVAISPGRSERFLTPGEQVLGEYDGGATGLATKIQETLGELDTLFSALFDAHNALLGAQQQKRLARLGSGLKRQLNRAKGLGNAISDSLSLAYSALQQGVQCWDSLWSESDEARRDAGEALSAVSAGAEELGNQIGTLGDQLERVVSALSETSDGSLAQMIHKAEFSALIDTTYADAQRLLKALSK